ncbi:MAG: hypothetical protein H7281_05235 [Bacteriovorax sp.]|nr:hypothetical protein [Bacteriovorax sp.]
MKNLFLISALTVVCSNAFALTVNGNNALNLHNALKNAGAEVKIYTDASFLSVSKVKCVQESGFVLLPMKCSFVDKSSGRLEEVNGALASSLSSALLKSGLKAVLFRAGELSTSTTSAKVIECSTAAVPRLINCEITK